MDGKRLESSFDKYRACHLVIFHKRWIDYVLQRGVEATNLKKTIELVKVWKASVEYFHQFKIFFYIYKERFLYNFFRLYSIEFERNRNYFFRRVLTDVNEFDNSFNWSVKSNSCFSNLWKLFEKQITCFRTSISELLN